MSLLKNWRELPVDALEYAAWNYKVDDDAKQAKLCANFKRNGQIENIIVRELGGGRYEVVNGNHRLKAMRALGIKACVAYDLGDVPLSTAQRIAVETNETKFDKDNLKLAQVLQSITADFSVADVALSMPFEEQEIVNFVATLSHDWSQYDPTPAPTPNPDEGPGTTDVDIMVTPEVKAAFHEAVGRVQRLLEERTGEAVTESRAMLRIVELLAATPDNMV